MVYNVFEIWCAESCLHNFTAEFHSNEPVCIIMDCELQTFEHGITLCNFTYLVSYDMCTLSVVKNCFLFAAITVVCADE